MTDVLHPTVDKRDDADPSGESSPPPRKTGMDHQRAAAPDPHTEKDSSVETAEPNQRKRVFLIIATIIVIAALSYWFYYWLVLSKYASTDNAYVGAETAQITPLVGGAIKTVNVSDTDTVTRGQILMTIDDADARIVLDRAQASLAMAVRKYGQTTATGQALAASVNTRSADITRARAQLLSAQGDVARAKVDYDRRKALVASGAVSGDELTAAINALQTAESNLRVARAGVAQAESSRASAERDAAANTALTRGTTAATAPEVLDARAAVEQAKLDFDRTLIRAPIDGVVAQRTVQIGQRIAAGTPAMTVVPIGKLYVDANFKEGQLTKVTVGQVATLTSDLYGKDVVYHGRVVGFAGGTGSAFALIPAQNATGNWIKVVQRLPIRIALDPAELKDHPLRVGLSMDAEVDISSKR